MKVQNINRQEMGSQGVRASGVHEDSSDRMLVFRRTMSDLVGTQRQEHLAALIAGIDKQAMRLKKKSDIKEFERYRRLIREFLDDVVSNCYEYSKENSFAARGKQRFFSTIKTIDEKLDALAKEVLKAQADNIAVVNQLDDIRGLILDMIA